MKDTHTHRILPGYKGGTYDKFNVVELTVEEHAAWHKIYYQLWGNQEDKLAYIGLEGCIGKEDIIKERARLGSILQPREAKVRGGQIGGKIGGAMSKGKKRKPRTKEHLENISKALKGRKITDTKVLENMSNAMKGNIPWNKGKTGMQVAWNKGLTKETSPSMMKVSKKLSKKTKE